MSECKEGLATPGDAAPVHVAERRQQRQSSLNAWPRDQTAPWVAIFLPYAFGYFLSYLLRTVNAVMAPALTESLGISASDLGLLTGAYLAGFALMQLPLGVALDRYGPRRVQTILLLLTAFGCALFAVGHTLTHLVIARAIIGAGVSSCLMAAYKAFSQFFPLSRQASLNAAIMVAGGMGALSSSAPFSLLLPILGWRMIFGGLAVLAVLAAWIIFRVHDTSLAAGPGLPQPLGELKLILSNRSFWRFAPLMATVNGGFTAIQSLWAIPWLTQVAGLDRNHAAFALMLLNVALMVGYASLAATVGTLQRRGLTLGYLIAGGTLAFQTVSITLVLKFWQGYLPWAILGLSYAASNLSYAHHANRYPANLAGRANTCLNLALFVGGFVTQWGFGIVVDIARAQGYDQSGALCLAWKILLGMQFASSLWFVLSRNWVRKSESPIQN